MNASPKSGKIAKAFGIIILLFCFTSVRPAQADVDINIFYDALAPYGNWVNHRSYGRVWYPRNVPRNWRPYTDGYWAYTIEYGWLWVSDWEWGWAPFHYGRWAWDDWYGWIWIPGSIWAPAWVFWRYGGGYTAWAPMPPNYIWSPYASYQTYYFDHNRYLNWDCWVAVHDRDFPRHRKHRRLLAPQRNKEILGATNFINNVTFVNNNVVNQGLPVQQIENATGDRIKPIVPRVLTEAGDENRQLRRNLRSEAQVIYRPKDSPVSMDMIRDEEKRAMLIADKIEREPDITPARLLQPREPGRLTGKPRPIDYDDLSGSLLKLPNAQPTQREMPMLTVPDQRSEGRIAIPNDKQSESIIRLNEKAEQELRAREAERLQKEVYRQQEIQRQQQWQIQQQAEQEQRVRESARQQEELDRQQEIQHQQEFQMQQQAEQELRAQEKALQQEEKLYRQQEIQRQQQWEMQQQAEQEQRGREAQQQEELDRQQVIQRQQQWELQQQTEQEQRGREAQQQEELDRQQEIQRRQQWEMQQQAEQEQRVRGERQQQEQLYRQQEIQRQQQWQMQQQYEQGQRSRPGTRQQLEVVPQQETEQQPIRQPMDGQRQQTEQIERGRVGRSIGRGDRSR